MLLILIIFSFPTVLHLFDHLVQLHHFHSLLLPVVFFQASLSTFVQPPLLQQQNGRKKTPNSELWKRTVSINSLPKKLQQQKVSQVEKSAKHSSIAYIGKKKFCWARCNFVVTSVTTSWNNFV